MSFIIVSIISTVVTFIWGLSYSKLLSKKSKHTNFKNYHLHHSIVGVLLLLLGFFLIPFYGTTTAAIGFGIFLSHGLEEIYINHENLPKAFFVFITKGKENDNI